MIGGLWLDLFLVVVLVILVLLLWPSTRVPRWLAARTSTGSSRSGGVFRTWYRRLARQAGYDPARLLWLYWGSKIFFALLLPLVMLEIVGSLWPLVLAMLVFGFLLPDLALMMIRLKRQGQIRWGLSFLADLMVAFLKAGLNVEDALRRAAANGFALNHPLAQEVELLSAELDLGESREQAFSMLGERTGVQEAAALGAALRVASKHGVRLEEILEEQAELLRVKRREETRKRINVASVKILFPIFLCGFPVFIVLVFYPAILEMVDVFRELGRLF